MDAKNLIEESVKTASAMKSEAKKAALKVFTDVVLKEDIQNILKEEGLNLGPDQPSGYDQDGKQKRVSGVGDSLEDKGDGPAIIEGDDPPDGKIKLEGDPLSNVNLDGKEKNEPNSDDDDDLNLDLESVFAEDDEKEKEDKKKKDESVEDKEKEDKEKKNEGVEDKEKEKKAEDKEKETMKNEAIQLKKTIAKLKTENLQLTKTLQLINNKMNEANLINTKMGYIQGITEA